MRVCGYLVWSFCVFWGFVGLVVVAVVFAEVLFAVGLLNRPPRSTAWIAGPSDLSPRPPRPPRLPRPLMVGVFVWYKNAIYAMYARERATTVTRRARGCVWQRRSRQRCHLRIPARKAQKRDLMQIGAIVVASEASHLPRPIPFDPRRRRENAPHSSSCLSRQPNPCPCASRLSFHEPELVPVDARFGVSLPRKRTS